MAWIEVRLYAAKWNTNSKRGSVGLWLVGGSQDPKLPDRNFTNLDGADFAAMCAVLRGDPDHKVAFESVSNELSSSFDAP